MKFLYMATLLALLASISPAVAQSETAAIPEARPIFLDCPEIRDDGAKIHDSIGRLPGSQVKILVSKKKIYTWNWEGGGGYFKGGGQWIEFKAELTVSDSSFWLSAEDMFGLPESYLINRVDGSIRASKWDGEKRIVKSGVCEPTKDPEAIPAPKAAF